MTRSTDISNPNDLLAHSNSKGHGSGVKDALGFLKLVEVIKDYSVIYDFNRVTSVVEYFEIWSRSTEHPPLVLSPDEAWAFCKGARAQNIKSEEKWRNITDER